MGRLADVLQEGQDRGQELGWPAAAPHLLTPPPKSKPSSRSFIRVAGALPDRAVRGLLGAVAE